MTIRAYVVLSWFMKPGALCLVKGGDILRFVKNQGELVSLRGFHSKHALGTFWVFPEEILRVLEDCEADRKFLFQRLAQTRYRHTEAYRTTQQVIQELLGVDMSFENGRWLVREDGDDDRDSEGSGDSRARGSIVGNG